MAYILFFNAACSYSKMTAGSHSYCEYVKLMQTEIK